MVNFPIILLAALVPLVLGFIWYHPRVFGTAWKRSAGVPETRESTGRMIGTLLLTYFLGFLIAFGLQFMVIHQYHLYSILANEPSLRNPESELSTWLTGFMAKYGQNFRTFKHGMLHGTLGGFMVAVPIIGINARYERKGFKYFIINAGFWIISMMLMGGIICQYA